MGIKAQGRMGIDLVKRGRIKNKHKKDTKSKNLYHHLLVKLFKFLSRRTGSKFCKTVLRRLVSSRVNRPPLSLTKYDGFQSVKFLLPPIGTRLLGLLHGFHIIR